MSNSDRILSVLRDGPATSAEIALELGMPSSRACDYLGRLVHRGRVARSTTPVVFDGRPMHIYALPEHRSAIES